MIEISHDVRVAGDGVPQRHALPAVPGAVEHQPGLTERIGKSVRDRFGLVGLTAGIGGLAGVLALRRSPLAAIGGGIGGVLAGAALATLGSMLLPPSLRLADGGGPTAPTDVAAPEQVRVMTVNLRGGFGQADRLSLSNPLPTPREHLSAIADQIRRERPDVVLFQEMDDRHVRSLFMDQVDWFAGELHPEDAALGLPREDVSGMFERVGGQAVMTFNGFTIDNARELADPALPKYGTMDTLVRTPKGTYLRAMSTHQHGHAIDGFRQLTRSVEEWGGPTILGGDFNRRSGSKLGHRETEALAGAGLRDTFLDVGIPDGDRRRISFDSGGADIDRINVSRHFTAERVEVLHDAPTHSDHRAVVADLRLDAAGA